MDRLARFPLVGDLLASGQRDIDALTGHRNPAPLGATTTVVLTNTGFHALLFGSAISMSLIPLRLGHFLGSKKESVGTLSLLSNVFFHMNTIH